MTTRRGDQPPDLSDEAVPTSEVNPPGLPITNSWPAVGLIWGNAGALASAAVPEHPGTGSAVLGMLQWGTAGIAAPLAGLGGSGTAVPMAVMMTVGAAVSIVGLLVILRSTSRLSPH